MKLLYQNNYGTSYFLKNAPNPKCKIQLLITSIGIFMSKSDLKKLLAIVNKSSEPCNCHACGGRPYTKIWQTNNMVDVCLHVNETKLNLLENLIEGTLFMLNPNNTLEQYRLKTKK